MFTINAEKVLKFAGGGEGRAPSISPMRGSARLWFSDESDQSDLSDLSDSSENPC